MGERISTKFIISLRSDGVLHTSEADQQRPAKGSKQTVRDRVVIERQGGDNGGGRIDSHALDPEQ